MPNDPTSHVYVHCATIKLIIPNSNIVTHKTNILFCAIAALNGQVQNYGRKQIGRNAVSGFSLIENIRFNKNKNQIRMDLYILIA